LKVRAFSVRQGQGVGETINGLLLGGETLAGFERADPAFAQSRPVRKLFLRQSRRDAVAP
jgi:hypothetical protein